MDPEIERRVEALLPQARSEAWSVYQSAPHALELDELVSLAYKGLTEAANRWPAYCESRGFDPTRFEYFAAYCCVPETPVLTAGLDWVPVGDVAVGDELVGVEEDNGGSRGRRRHYEGAKVLSAHPRQAACLRFVFEDGREVVCSFDHRWLASLSRRGSVWKWTHAADLRPGQRVCAPLRVWDRGASRDDGWLAGILDGEGCYMGVPGRRRGIQFSQNRGAVLDKVFAELDRMGIPYRLGLKNGGSVVRVNVNAAWARLELVGRLQPVRFDGRPLWEGAQVRNRDGVNYAVVERVEPAGVREVVTLETSSGTYLANGLVAHNCLRRVRGSMLDAMRSQDWLTRSMRTRAKAIRDAGADLGKTEAELAEATGLSVAQVRETLAAQSRRPSSFDAEPAELPEDRGVEEDVVVSSILAAVTRAVRGMAPGAQALLALRYYAGWDLAEAAESLGMEAAEAAALHHDAVQAVHQAMLRAAVEGG